MSIRVGIHNNLVIAKTVKNDKGSLVIGVKKMVDQNPLELLNSSRGNTSFNSEENDFLIYPPRLTNFDGDKLAPDAIAKEIANIVDPLSHILSQYLTSNNIKWDLMKGTDIDRDNYTVKIVQQETINKIYSNIVTQFITMMAPFVGEQGKRLRGVFPRTSKAKHFPALRRRFLDRQPIFESMEVPQEASRVKFSDYEIANGLNVADPVAPSPVASSTDASLADKLFVTK